MIADHIKDRQKENVSWATEKDSLSVEKLEAMQEEFPNAQFKYSLTRFIQEMQLYKSQDELDLMIKAGQDADYAFQIGFNALRNGISEKQVVAEIEYALQKRGVMHTSLIPLFRRVRTLQILTAHQQIPKLNQINLFFLT